jgi:gliding motility-associated-like protein
MIRKNMKHLLGVLVLGSLLTMDAIGQVTATPTVYSSTGGSGSVSANFLVDYTVGEPVILTIANSGNILTQGFQQPLDDSLIGPGGPSDSLLGIYNGLTPNGDGHNEIWYISGIDTLPDNEVLIYNRWGELIWKGEHYDNVNVAWNGKSMNGDDVVPGTYYFAILLKDRKNYTGWIELSR